MLRHPAHSKEMTVKEREGTFFFSLSISLFFLFIEMASWTWTWASPALIPTSC